MAEYLIEPLDTDADVIFNNFVDYVRVTYPDWEPSEAQLDVIIARYFSMQTAFTADMASRVQRAIFRYFGANLANLPPYTGTQASAIVHFVVDDPATPPVNRTLPFGTLVGLTDVDGDVQLFELMDDLEIAAGITSGEVEARALESGVVSNNLTGTVELVEQVDWIRSAQVVGASSGGSDPEQDDAYLQRLTENLALMAPRPLLAEDFTVFARNIIGVARAAVIANFRPGAIEKQRLVHNYTGGTLRLAWPTGTDLSSPIPWNATADQVRSGLAAITGLTIYDISVTGGPLPAPVDIEFIGRFGYQNVAPIITSSSGLTGGSSITITTLTPGSAYAVDLENSIAISGIDVNGNPLAPTTRDALIEYLESTRAQNFLITYIAPAYYVVDVNYTARISRGESADSVKSAINANLANYLNPANWGRDPYTQSYIWVKQSAVRYLELTTLVENTPGVDYIESLTFRITEGGAFNSSDKPLPVAFGLTRPGAFVGTIDLPI